MKLSNHFFILPLVFAVISTPLAFAAVDLVGVDIFCDNEMLLGFTALIPFLEICPIETTSQVQQQINIALILVEPDGLPDHDPTHNTAYFQDIANELTQYFDEVSYGFIDLNVEIFDNGGNWYALPEQLSVYAADRPELIRDTIETVPSGVIDYTQYDYDVQNGIGAVVIVSTSFDPTTLTNNDFTPAFVHALSGTGAFPVDTTTIDGIVVPEGRFLDQTKDIRGAAHEIGHALGKLLVTSQSGIKDTTWSLPHTSVTGEWSLMGPRTDFPPAVHMISFTKEWVNWLEYSSVTDGTHTVNSLPTMEFGEDILRIFEDQTTPEDFFIMEARTTSTSYSTFDAQVPHDAFVLYFADIRPQANAIDTVNLRQIEDLSIPGPLIIVEDSIEKTFEITNVIQGSEKFEVEVEVRPTTLIDRIVVILDTFAELLFQAELNLFNEITEPLPDIDLHVFTSDGRHIGVNYITGEYENQILDARTPGEGDMINGKEWISIPTGIDVQFVISSRDNQIFLDAFPEIEEHTDGSETYNLDLRFYDETGARSDSNTITQIIPPDTSISHPISITQNPDGTFSVVIEEPTRLSILEGVEAQLAWLEDAVNVLDIEEDLKEDIIDEISEIHDELSEIIDEIKEGEDDDDINKDLDELIEEIDELIEDIEEESENEISQSDKDSLTRVLQMMINDIELAKATPDGDIPPDDDDNDDSHDDSHDD